MGAPQSPVAKLARELRELKRLVRQRPAPRYIVFHDGTRNRQRVGLMEDGTYGMRVWDETGALQIDDTA